VRVSLGVDIELENGQLTTPLPTNLPTLQRRGVFDMRQPSAMMKRGIFSTAMSQASTQTAFTDESSLISMSRSGDGAAFTQLVNRYSRKVFRLAKHITQNNEDADDVLQDTFLKAYEHLGEFQEQSKFYTWIVRITVNESLMKLRKRRAGKIVSLDEPVDTGEEIITREIAVWDDNPEQRYSLKEMHEILEQAVDGLAPIFRTVFVLRDIDELSTEETASALGISVPAVKSRLLRARLQLREKLTRFFKRKADDVFAYL
jgi:RNA polymerase sigma-70 factor, ECF subfamily